MALIRTEQRICFGLKYFDDEAEAQAEGDRMRKAGYTFNGGWFHGKPCGRETQFDYFDKEIGKELFAVSY